MSEFEFVFTLFGLVLGLALAEIFGGLRTAIQSRRKIRIGVLTPLLGLIVAFDLVSFWLAFWYAGENIPTNSISMIGGLVITGVYYLVAGLVFPGDPAEWPDYDSYFFGHKKLVFGGMILCNALGMAGQAATSNYDPFGTSFSAIATVTFFTIMTVAMFLPGRRTNVIFLSIVAAMYPVFSIVDVLVGGAAS